MVRDHSTLVTGPLEPAARAVAERVAGERHARWVESPALADVPLRAAGAFQRQNFALACAAAEAFLGRAAGPRARWPTPRPQTRIPGRLDPVAERPLVLHDGAHNPAGARALAQALPEVLGDRRPRVLVASVLEDKDAAAMLEALLGEFDEVVFTRCSNPRALSPATLESLAARNRGSGTARARTVPDPRAAVRAAPELAGPDGRGGGHRIDLPDRRPGAPRRGRARLDDVGPSWREPPTRGIVSRMERGDGPRFGVMIGLVALVVATVILVFFGIGYLLGNLFL